MTPMKTLLSGATLFALAVLSGSPYSSALAAETKPTSQAQISITQAELDTLLKDHKLSGVSLAVIDNYEVVLTASSGESVLVRVKRLMMKRRFQPRLFQNR